MDSLIDYISNLTITQGAATGEAGSSRSFRPRPAPSVPSGRPRRG